MKLDILKGHWVDMIFEGRNQKYGAYVLRKESPRTTILAYIIGTSIIVGLLIIPLISSMTKEDVAEEEVTLVDMSKLDAPKKPEAPKPMAPKPIAPPPPPAPKIDQVKFVKPEVVKKELVTEEIKTIKELKDANVGSSDVKGREDGHVVIGDEAVGTGDPNAEVVGAPVDDQVYTSVEVRPDFPGGIQKFYEYVGRTFRAPEEDGVSGRVIVQFVVEKDGNLTDIKVIRDIGYGTGKEAIRVLNNSPKWKPGMQNGRPVRVLYSLPITITANN